MKLTKNRLVYLLGFIFVVGSLFSMDIFTKMLAQKHFLVDFSHTDINQYVSTSLPVFKLGGDKNWLDFSLTYVRNTGAAWGMFSNMDERFRPYFFNTVTIIAMLVIILVIRTTPRSKLLSRLALFLIFSGACGNFFDRFFLHYVIDWLHVRWSVFSWYYDFPVFNIADSCVTIGVSLLLIDMFLSEYRGKKRGSTTIS